MVSDTLPADRHGKFFEACATFRQRADQRVPDADAFYVSLVEAYGHGRITEREVVEKILALLGSGAADVMN